MNISATLRTILSAHVGVMLISLSANALAEDKVDLGKIEYDSTCAVCHGLNGKGDNSALKMELLKPVPNLTELAKSNAGVFPVNLVYEVIDGRKEVKAHGLREMPVWGQTFNNKTSIYFEQKPPFNSEYIVRSRILALIDYLSRLQEK
ncbi:cytochrome c [Methylococcaceae bacterium WWC4]|nr:cytochrome c [Methylococcaceae bacterium WWC4]